MSGSSATQLVGKYLASKGLPVTGENVRRALEMNASNPGVIPGLVNQAPPPPDNVGPQTTQSTGAAKRQPALQTQGGTHEVGSGVKPTAPRAASDSAASAPQPQAQAQGGGLLQSIAALIMGGGAGGGLAALMRNGAANRPGGANYEPNVPVEPQGLGISNEPMHVGGPAQVGSPAQLPAPAQPLQISDRNMVGEGVQPVGPPQPGRMEVGPSSQVPPTGRPVETAQINMPPNTGQSSVRNGAPVSPTVAGAGVPSTPMELPQGINWSKVLGEVAGGAGKVLRR